MPVIVFVLYGVCIPLAETTICRRAWLVQIPVWRFVDRLDRGGFCSVWLVIVELA